MKSTIKPALINALLTSAYIIIVAIFIYFLGHTFPGPNNSVFVIIAMLMLFVFSAALTGTLVFGKPIMLYLEKRKKEALSLLFYTLSFLFIITIIAFVFLFRILG